MKKLISITSMIFVAIAMLCYGCTRPEETGSVYGTITDFETGEPIKNANVTLRPSGETTLTGSDGTYMFQDLKKGDYSLSLKLAGYEDLDDQYVIHLETGKNVRRDVQMKKKVALRITDENGTEISVLDFGEEIDDVSRIFNIVNESGSALSWEITTTANWIESPENGTSGTLQAGGKKGMVVVIDRSKLQQGDNTTTLHITSDNGNQQLTIKAGRSDVSTLEATLVNSSTAILNGCINTGIPYSEKGFFYGTGHNLNTRKIVSGSGVGAFSAQVAGLENGSTYYYKAYCVVNGTQLFGEEKSFGPIIPSFEYGGHTYWVAPDPGVSMYMGTADSYCENLTLYGYSDWKMPSKEELMQMYTNRAFIGGFSDNYYWSSSGWNIPGSYTYYAYVINFSDGILHESIIDNYNNPMYCVRPIRLHQ